MKEIRQLHNLSQADLSNLSGGRLSQTTISSWERKRFIPPTFDKVLILAKSFGVRLCDVPWDHISLVKVDEDEKEEGCSGMNYRFGLYDLPKATSVKTFSGNIYEIKGFIGIDQDTGEAKPISDIYYRAKTVAYDSGVIAKRKGQDDELISVSRKRKQ